MSIGAIALAVRDRRGGRIAQTIYKCKGDGRAHHLFEHAVRGRRRDAADRRAGAGLRSATTARAATPAPEAAPSDDAAASAPAYRARAAEAMRQRGVAAVRRRAARQRRRRPTTSAAFSPTSAFGCVRCEFTRFTAEERRERDAAMRDLEAPRCGSAAGGDRAHRGAVRPLPDPEPSGRRARATGSGERRRLALRIAPWSASSSCSSCCSPCCSASS